MMSSGAKPDAPRRRRQISAPSWLAANYQHARHPNTTIMSAKLPLSGCDNLMLGFDYELRRRGYAGNYCQVVLELTSTISPDALRKRLADLIARYPILCARPGGIIFPEW